MCTLSKYSSTRSFTKTLAVNKDSELSKMPFKLTSVAVAVSVLCGWVVDLAVWCAVVTSCVCAVHVNLARVACCTFC